MPRSWMSEQVALIEERNQGNNPGFRCALSRLRLLRSLNQPESEIDKEWAAVAQRRLAEMRSGLVEPLPGENVFEKIWKRLDK